MLHPVSRHALFEHRFVEAVTWQPLVQVLRSRARTRLILPTERGQVPPPISARAA